VSQSGRRFFVDVSKESGVYSRYHFACPKGWSVFKRLPRHYDGPLTTTRHLRQLLPSFLEEVGRKCNERPDLVVAAWPKIVGSKLAPMTQAVSFIEGVLTVKVNNATLYSLLSQNDKARLIQELKNQFPGTFIKTIFFLRG
jgi:hypothetical protein